MVSFCHVLALLCLVQCCQGFVSFPARIADRRAVQLNSSLYAKPKVDDIFDEYFAESIAKDVYKSLDIPFFIPEPVVTYMIEQTIRNLSVDLSKDTKLKLQEMMEAYATPTSNDDFVTEEIHELADRIAKEINPKIDVPVLDEQQEYLLLQQILRVVLQTALDKKSRRQNLVKWTNTNLQMSRELLGGRESRLMLAKSIDKKITIPLPLEEAQRLALISQAVDSSADLLTRLLPPDLLETLKGESPEGLLKMKEYLIDTVNAKVDIVGINEEQEKQLIETMINLLIDEYVDETDAEFLLLTQDEQQERLQERKLVLERQKIFSQRRYEREQVSLDRKLARIEERLKEIRKSKSFLRRLFRRGKKKKN